MSRRSTVIDVLWLAALGAAIFLVVGYGAHRATVAHCNAGIAAACQELGK